MCCGELCSGTVGYGMGSLMRKPVLVLNASYEAVRIIAAKRAMTLICKGAAMVEISTGVEIYPGITLPSVIRLRTYRRIPVRLQLVSRKNLYVRDNYCCLYCGKKFHGDELTLDHVIPKSKGGSNSWDNLVTCCSACNRRKADRTPGEASMPLLRRPIPLSVHTSRHVLRAMASDIPEWSQFLYHDSAGDERFVAR